MCVCVVVKDVLKSKRVKKAKHAQTHKECKMSQMSVRRSPTCEGLRWGAGLLGCWASGLNYTGRNTCGC